MRICYVFADNIFLLSLNFTAFRNHLYVSTLRLVARFHYPQFIFFSILFLGKESIPIRLMLQNIGCGNEVIFLRVFSLNFGQVIPKTVLSSHVPTLRKMINFLETIHIFNLVLSSSSPEYIPIIIFCFFYPSTFECICDAPIQFISVLFESS